ncbi:hypothetical protein [Sphingobacterium hungaricum]|uniref:Uncharacterized protein n=1 Tax=Sphingobacterium hungaricum TaxID=2082723 RepID=A0A928YS36_9SPHI|nr:hypothetical protein [Sphingobacterium hungaricum]MBE8714825.1 hypothetical protein [Sphingobacterium hungaricum]
MKTQKRLFESIREIIPQEDLLVDHIVNVLNISKHQAYARIAGKIWLDLDSGKKLMDFFKIPSENVFGKTGDDVSFQYTDLNMSDFNEYRAYLKHLTGMLNAAKIKKDCTILFLADDIPIFHYMPFPELIFFKLYSWSVDTVGISLTYEAFVKQANTSELKDLFTDLYNAYLDIPSVEVWSQSTIDVILNEIVEYNKFRAFSEHKSVGILLEQVDAIWQNHKIWGSQRKKESGRSFDLFYSGTPALGGKMLLEAEDYSRAVIKLYTINSISTDNMLFIGELRRYMRSVLDRGMLIGASTREKRLEFEHTIESKLEKARKILSFN